VQHATQVQIRFLIAVLTKMANQDPLGALLSPASSQDKGKQLKMCFRILFRHMQTRAFYLTQTTY
jgi:hypothetical protein